MTICWHVDDLFLGHGDPSLVTWILDWLSHCYDIPDKKVNATRSPHHDYLGMNIDFSTQGRVAFDIIPYITKIIDAFPEKISGIALSPEADHLFTSVLCLMQNFSLSFKLVRTITPRHNFFSFHLFVVISKQLWLFSLLASKHQMKMTGEYWNGSKNIYHPLVTFIVRFLLTLLLTSNGMLMPPIRLMMIAMVTQAAFLPLAKAQPPVLLQNKKSLPKAPLKQNSLVSMTNQVTFYRHDVSSKLKVTKSL
jgi:hypothetical protein